MIDYVFLRVKVLELRGFVDELYNSQQGRPNSLVVARISKMKQEIINFEEELLWVEYYLERNKDNKKAEEEKK